MQLISQDGYSAAAIIGYSDNYFQWLSEKVQILSGDFELEAKEAALEYNMAKRVNTKVGENITLEYKTKSGAINTARFKVKCIFVGNKYIHGFKVYAKINDVRELAMEEKPIVQSAKIYLNDNSDKNIQESLDYLEQFQDKIKINIWKWTPKGNVFFNVFSFTQIFMKILTYLVTFILIIILFFGIQNSFYLIFNERATEISVLATYGMTFGKMYKIIFWETIMILLSGIFLGFGLASIFSFFLSKFNISQISSEFIVVLGGPNLVFDFSPLNFVMVFSFIFIVGLFSTFWAQYKYFKSEVREMQMGI